MIVSGRGRAVTPHKQLAFWGKVPKVHQVGQHVAADIEVK